MNSPPLVRLLMIGSLPPPVGGTTVSFKLLVDELERSNNVSVRVIDTSGIRSNSVLAIVKFLIVLLQTFYYAFRSDVVSLHQVPTGLSVLGPFVLLMVRIARKPFILRIFAGIDYMDYGWLRSNSSHCVARGADIYLAQTRELVQLAVDRGLNHAQWYPTSRRMPLDGDAESSSSQKCERFVFVGDVTTGKGIKEILQADLLLDDRIVIDVYGPIKGDVPISSFERALHVRYKGVVENDNMFGVLQQYDAMLLPTHHEGEGYPGVIIEAFAAGLPIICTDWKALPELVDETCGILIPIKDGLELANAIAKIFSDEDLYHKFKRGIVKKRTEHSLERWSNHLAKISVELSSR